ncbi:hypothetical protein LCGC14_2683420, partial [marine sediment metagenome]
MTQDMIDKLYKFTEQATAHMFEAEVIRNRMGEFLLIIHSDQAGIRTVEAFVTAAPLNVMTLLNEIGRLKEIAVKALVMSKENDQKWKTQEDSELTKLLADTVSGANSPVTVEDKSK